MAGIEQLLSDFEYLGDWQDRYRYVIELGGELPPLAEAERTDANKVRGCVSQVWLTSRAERDPETGEDVLIFAGDSDAHIVRGLIAILFSIYNGQTPRRIIETDSRSLLERLGLEEHLTPQRSNGLFAMVNRIRADAAERLEVASSA